MINIAAIKTTFKANFSYFSFLNKAKHAVGKFFKAYNSELTGQVEQQAAALNTALERATTSHEFFNAIIERIANVYVEKQKQGAKKNIFEDSIKHALTKCLGSGNEFFDFAIKEVIKRMNMLPDDFHKNYEVKDDLKAQIAKFFWEGCFDKDYVQENFNPDADQTEFKNTPFFVYHRPSSFDRNGVPTVNAIKQVFKFEKGVPLKESYVGKDFENFEQICAEIDKPAELAVENVH